MLTARDFELLLPWYLNGTLTGRERDLVVAYLREHPEQGVKVQWHTSLRAGIKGEADQLPQDLGLERVLVTVRRGVSQAPDRRSAHAGRSFAVDVAGWLASLGQGRGAWAVALASVTLVVGTIAIFATVMTRPAQSPGTTVAQSTSGPTSTSVASPFRRTDETVSVERAPPKAPPLAAPVRVESKVARRPPERDLQPTPPAPTVPERSESPQVAQAPAATVTPPLQTGVLKASDSSASPGTATGLASAPEASPSPQQSVVGAADLAGSGKLPETTTLSSTATPERAITSSTSRAAISGKANTSCPSTNKQREDALRAANPDQPIRTPEAWIEYIKELLKAGCRDAADQQWVELHKKYPDVKIPPGLETSK